MQVRILSDLHIDQNRHLELEDKNTFTIIAGDISKNPNISIDWIRANLRKGLFIEGNHAFTNEGLPLQVIYDRLRLSFPIDNNISFLQNEYKEINNKIFIGCTLWTDFKLGGYYSFTKNYGSYRSLDSYIRGNILDENLQKRKLTMDDTIKEFNKSIAYIDYVCKSNPNKDVIVISHHCPSMVCSAPKFKDSILNPALISYLDPFILSHKNIKAWICGHCHRDPLDTYIGQCRILMNSRGYTNFNECPNFNEDFIVEI